MKFTFKKRRSPVKVYKDWCKQHCNRLNEKYVEDYNYLCEWHEKFAWLPTRLTTDDEEKSQWVILEKIHQKAVVDSRNHHIWTNVNVAEAKSWTRYTSKDYFAKRLRGEIKVSQSDDENQVFTHDGTNQTLVWHSAGRWEEKTLTIKRLREILDDEEKTT